MVVGHDPEFGSALSQRVELRGLEHGLGRYAAAVEAGAAQAVALDQEGASAELGGAERGHVAAGTATDDGDVITRGQASLLGLRYASQL
jgi:hypothetical protein